MNNMSRYKTRNQTALANSSEGTNRITSKRKLEHTELESDYFEEPCIALPDTREKSVFSNTVKNSKGTLTTSPDILGSNISHIEESIEVTPQIKYVSQTYSRTKGRLPKTLGSNISHIEESIEVTPQIKYVSQTYSRTKGRLPKTLGSNISHIEESIEVTPQIKYVSQTYSRTKGRLPKTLGSNISHIEESIEVTPQIKYVSQTYSRTKGRLSKTYEKNEKSHLSSITSTSDIPETTSSSFQIKQYGVPKSKRLCSHKTKLQIIELQSASANSNPDALESNIPCDKEPIDPFTKQAVRTYSRSKKKNDNSKNTSSNACLNVIETNYVASKMETKLCSTKTRKKKISPNLNAGDLELNISNAKKTAKVAPQKKTIVKTYSPRENKERLSKTCNKNNASQSSSMNSSPVIPEPKVRPLPKRQCRAKKQNLVETTRQNESQKDLACSVSDDSESDIQIVKEIKSQTKQVAQKRKKVCFSVPKGSEGLLSNSSNSNIDSKISMDYLPLITESCKNRLRTIVSTAVQIQRHSHRRSLTEADFIKSLVFHNYFEEDSSCDIVECETDSETLVIDEDFTSITCQGKWLHR